MINIQWTEFEQKSIVLLFRRNYLKCNVLGVRVIEEVKMSQRPREQCVK